MLDYNGKELGKKRNGNLRARDPFTESFDYFSQCLSKHLGAEAFVGG